jgi:hypothetical protein
LKKSVARRASRVVSTTVLVADQLNELYAEFFPTVHPQHDDAGPAPPRADLAGLHRGDRNVKGAEDRRARPLTYVPKPAVAGPRSHEGANSTRRGHRELAADWDNLRTPETYLGDGRSQGFASPGGATFERSTYELPQHLHLNHWALAGEWTIGQEKILLDQAGGSIAYRFHARDAHLVLSPGASGPIPFRVLVDGEAPGPSHGVDVDETGKGTVRDGRLYQLLRAHGTVHERTLEIVFQEAGAEAYALTFG